MWKLLVFVAVLIEAVAIKMKTTEDVTNLLGLKDFKIPAACEANLKEIATKIKEQSWFGKLLYSTWFWTIIAGVMGVPLLMKKLIPGWLRWTFYMCFFTASLVMIIINTPFIRRPVLKMLQAEEYKADGCEPKSS
jgi:hypothetical protein